MTIKEEYRVLDHGFVRLVDVMGTDVSVVEAARVSTGSVSKDTKLIDYLMKHGHTSPFEMCELKFHIKAPIFVARQWLRHRTANVNEMSGRYRELPCERYIPDTLRVQGQDTTNKQGSDGELSAVVVDDFLTNLWHGSFIATTGYDVALSDGVARELARIGLPLNTYTEFFWKNDLHNTLGFLKQRLHPHAQWEIRQYAELIAEFVKQRFPVSWEAFDNHVLSAHTLSRDEAAMLNEVIEEFTNANT